MFGKIRVMSVSGIHDRRHTRLDHRSKRMERWSCILDVYSPVGSQGDFRYTRSLAASAARDSTPPKSFAASSAAGVSQDPPMQPTFGSAR